MPSTVTKHFKEGAEFAVLQPNSQFAKKDWQRQISVHKDSAAGKVVFAAVGEIVNEFKDDDDLPAPAELLERDFSGFLRMQIGSAKLFETHKKSSGKLAKPVSMSRSELLKRDRIVVYSITLRGEKYSGEKYKHKAAVALKLVHLLVGEPDFGDELDFESDEDADKHTREFVIEAPERGA